MVSTAHGITIEQGPLPDVVVFPLADQVLVGKAINEDPRLLTLTAGTDMSIVADDENGTLTFNSGANGVTLLPGIIKGCNIANGTNTTTLVTGGSVTATSLDGTISKVLRIEDVGITCNYATNGVNGLRTGTIAANTWYAQYVIGDSTGQNNPQTMADVVYPPASLPAGYDVFSLVGTRKTLSGAATLRPIVQTGSNNTRETLFQDNSTDSIVLENGNATSYTQVPNLLLARPTLSSVTHVLINWFLTNAVDESDFSLCTTQDISTIEFTLGTPMPNVTEANLVWIPVGALNNLFYKVTNGTSELDLDIVGYREDL